MNNDLWPALPLAEWKDTYATLHMWTQIVGKIRLAQTPLVNHWWNVPLYVTARGLTTSPMPYNERTFEIDFDFVDHQLLIKCNDGSTELIPLVPRSVADFYQKVMQKLHKLGIEVKIWSMPVEVENPIPFEQDHENASYDPEYANRFWQILVRTDKVFHEFRSRFIGKCSPVHFYWGSFDLAVTRFSGRRAPEREGADSITKEAYSHEVISHGFWPGIRASGAVERSESEGTMNAPAFYSYTAPEPPSLSKEPIRPSVAFYSPPMKEFILLYDDVRNADSPEFVLLDFLQTTYEAGANLAAWDRAALERVMV
ncbi:MAG: hypothetical protein KME05_20635 [Gloeocapsa sp. UFS-A4-WI-NPMV-4B04]|jgi:hypothetical protein|nr:hypothetical protein [Gloeocapsa sp. UFS-A4-WI-NPMV-4B04]